MATSSFLRKMEKVFGNKVSILFLWIGFAATFFGAFIVLTSEVQEAANGEEELIGSIDSFVTSSLQSIRSPGISEVATNITALGSGAVVTILVIIAAVLMMLFRKYHTSIHLIVAAIGSGILTKILKLCFVRPRPVDVSHLVVVDGFSYPSGHSLTSAAVYFTFAIIFCNETRDWNSRWIVMALSLILICLIAITRVYLGVHFISDVLAGVLLGVGWAALLGGVAHGLEIRRSKK